MPSSIAPKVQNPGSAHLRLARGLGGLLLMTVMVLAAGAIGCGAEHGRGEGGKGCHGGHGGGGGERFDLGRSRMGMFRTDSQTGRTWIMPLNGDGGWIERGTAPGLAGMPARNGRFEVLSIGPIREPVGRGSRIDSAVLVRFDHATGRTWLLATEEAETWTEADDTQAPPDVELSPGQAAASAATEAARPAPSGGQGATTSEALDESSAKAYPILTGDQLGVTPEEKQETLDTLHNALTKEGLPSKMRVWAVRQLGELDPDLSAPELIVVLDDEDPVVVAEAVRQLGRMGRASTLPAILKLRNHPDPVVREAVSETVVAVP